MDAVAQVLEQADESVIAAMNENAHSGMAVGIVHQGQLVYAKGFGLADADSGRPVTPATVFRIGSITKTFTTVGLMQLWERDMFQLDDPVNNHLKSFKVQHRDPHAPDHAHDRRRLRHRPRARAAGACRCVEQDRRD